MPSIPIFVTDTMNQSNNGSASSLTPAPEENQKSVLAEHLQAVRLQSAKIQRFLVRSKNSRFPRFNLAKGATRRPRSAPTCRSHADGIANFAAVAKTLLRTLYGHF